MALGSLSFSDDGTHMAYSLSASGSDWLEWQVRDVATGARPARRPQVGKFSGAAWLKDGSGFFYSRYDAPKEGETFTGVNKFQKVYFHKLGTAQEADTLVYERKDQPDWGLSADVTDDGRFLLIYQSEGTKPENRIFVKDLSKPGATIQPFLDKFDADYTVVGNDAERFYVMTDKDAPRRRLVAIDLAKPDPSAWATIVPEASGRDVLASVRMVANRFVTRVADRRARGRQAVRARRHVRARGRAAHGRVHRRLQRQADAHGKLLQLLVVRLSRRRLPLRLRHGDEHRVQAAEGGLLADGLRDASGLLPVEGRHEDPDVPDLQEGPEEGRAEPDLPLWLRRVQRLDDAGVLARRRSRGWRWAASSRRPACAAAASTARRGTTPGGSRNKQNVFDDFIAGGRIPDSREIHVDAEAGDRRRQQRRPAGRRLPHPAARPVRRGAARRGRARHAALPQVHDRLGVEVRLRRSRRRRPISRR